ncbi:MAG: NfeD family protein [bacterium]
MEYFWLALVVLFAVAEAMTVGLVSLWFAVGALIAFFATSLGAPLWLQITLFVLSSALVLVLLRPVVQRYVEKKKQPTNADRVLGKVCPVTEEIDNLMGIGAVYIDGKTWTARTLSGEKLPKGAFVTVRDIQGVKLIVEPVRETVTQE